MARLGFALALHGGAGSSSLFLREIEKKDYVQTLANALRIGRVHLTEGGSSLDAVEMVVRFLEDDPKFNAGRGLALKFQGHHELDASIMNGRTRACGAVAGVETVRHPITAARLAMDKSPCIVLSGADQFSKEMGAELVDQDFFHTDRWVKIWKRARKNAQAAMNEYEKHLGTVGCVALDRDSNLATGGLTIKRYGRIGDSPLISAGAFSENSACAASCTGIGERFIKSSVVYDASALMSYKYLDLVEAAAYVFEHKLPNDSGGVISVDCKGSVVMQFNTRGMYRAAADLSGRFEIAVN